MAAVLGYDRGPGLLLESDYTRGQPGSDLSLLPVFLSDRLAFAVHWKNSGEGKESNDVQLM